MSRSRFVTEDMQRDWLARNVRRHRNALGLTIEAASQRGGLHPRVWQRIESNEANITLDTLAKVVVALEVAAVELLKEPAHIGGL